MVSDKKKKDRVRRKASKLFISMGITSVVLVVATYAWFIGTLQVSVNNIQIQIQSKEGLTISLDGNIWSQTIDVSKEAITTALTTSYPDNTNKWTEDTDHGGLNPLSSVGKLDRTHSVLELYYKASITALKGGYRLRSAKVENYDEDDNITETGEYVVFDLFVKNTSGTGYNSSYNYLEDEGVYLTPDSSAKINGTVGDGIQNSVRIGFFNIGRMELTASAADVQAISCTSSDEDVTPLCNLGKDDTPSAAGEAPEGYGITWNIYEPNDKKHNATSVFRFNKICLKRTVEEGVSTYSGTCTPVPDALSPYDEFADDRYVRTYAVHGPITAEDNVNVYDGLNSYDDDVYYPDEDEDDYTYGTGQKLTYMTYYTDSDVIDEDEDTRHEMIRLAPNSITKIRIYIWIEGQDADNYDVATLDDSGQIIDPKIDVQFGLTKDRFAYINSAS